ALPISARPVRQPHGTHHGHPPARRGRGSHRTAGTPRAGQKPPAGGIEALLTPRLFQVLRQAPAITTGRISPCPGEQIARFLIEEVSPRWRGSGTQCEGRNDGKSTESHDAAATRTKCWC